MVLDNLSYMNFIKIYLYYILLGIIIYLILGLIFFLLFYSYHKFLKKYNKKNTNLFKSIQKEQYLIIFIFSLLFSFYIIFLFYGLELTIEIIGLKFISN